jgi:hypothetical protein
MRRRFLSSSLVLALSYSGAGSSSPAMAAEPSALQPELRAAKAAEIAPTAVTKSAAESGANETAATPSLKLDVEVTALLRRTALALENRAIEPDEQAGFHALITAGDLLREDKTLAPSERERLRALCRVRLAQAEEVLKRQTSKERAAKEAKADDGKRKVVARNAVLKRPTTVDAAVTQPLAQQFPGGVGFGGQNPAGGAISPNATRASAEDLMEIITSSIKPESWEDNGGKGVIRYFQMGHALVIRATADVHGGVGGLVGQLRN